jgi:hypothetical protein
MEPQKERSFVCGRLGSDTSAGNIKIKVIRKEVGYRALLVDYSYIEGEIVTLCQAELVEAFKIGRQNCRQNLFQNAGA